MESYEKIDYGKLDIAIERLRAVTHEHPLKLLALIDKKGETWVKPIYIKNKLEQSITSQQLAILRMADLVKVRLEGKQKLYQVDYGRIQKVVETSESFYSSG